ncbi:thiamine phosphate synthase [Teredinibacter sp. KSP-S5-2]|uniref:thiamine phosphate synthase n=1 Tax=Teredinibacter sp. KSP-S5-2 TaxID=3034506 RepID=UPI002934546D|nr:thiamine phosphate synthase [Teredinibacter sp. KSP-S5-2]WNO11026.1 thiamine phosphate synthase [Teredinibacter sp. KSP-S5-2]
MIHSPALNTKPSVIAIGGSDSFGMSGIQMDNQVIRAMGCHSLNVITATTAQNNQSVLAFHPVDENTLQTQAQSLSCMKNWPIKSGLILPEHILWLAQWVKQSHSLYICDPIFTTTSGLSIKTNQHLQLLKKHILPLCDLITPNIDEAELLTGNTIHTQEDMIDAATALTELGAKAVYIKGGHLPHSKPYIQDFYFSKEKQFWLSQNKLDERNSRGTGCAFAAAVASAIALGYNMPDAAVIARMAISQGFRQGYAIKNQSTGELEKGPVLINRFPNKQADLPFLTKKYNFDLDSDAFPTCKHLPLGLYPIVGSFSELEQIINSGIKIAQLRIKDVNQEELENEINRAVNLAQNYQCQLFINDHWQLAIKYGAYGVHLGQEDLESADIQALKNAGLRLGISTHCHYEVARAHSFKPSYIACGPVFPTQTKIMPWTPLKPEGLNYWTKLLHYPVVAIGGIKKNQLQNIQKQGASGIAMITAISQSENPLHTATQFVELLNDHV